MLAQPKWRPCWRRCAGARPACVHDEGRCVQLHVAARNLRVPGCGFPASACRLPAAPTHQKRTLLSYIVPPLLPRSSSRSDYPSAAIEVWDVAGAVKQLTLSETPLHARRCCHGRPPLPPHEGC